MIKSNLKIPPHRTTLHQHSEMLKNTNRFQTLLTNLRYEGKPRLGANIQQTRLILKFLESKVIPQFRFEEKSIFPFLRRHIPKLEAALRLLEAEHDEFQSHLKSFQKSFQRFVKTGQSDGKNSEALKETGTYMVYLLRHHLKAENQVYKVMAENLRADEKAEIKVLFEKAKNHGGDKRLKDTRLF